MPVIVGDATLHHADCRDVLRGLPDNSIDSVVTDPPYALVSIQKRFGKPGSKPAKDVYGRGAAGFMGKSWDTGEVAFSEEFWAEVLRVLKPGGHVVAFSGTRTYHRMAVAIEDAGFEIRDQLGWLYGSGFPKSHDVSKGIDKKRDDSAAVDAVREWLELRRQESGMTRKAVNEALGLADNGGGLMSTWTTNRTTRAVPMWDQWLQLKDLLGFSDEMDDEVARLNGRKGEHGEAWQTAEVVGIKEGAKSGWSMDGKTKFVDREVKEANSEAARQWQGWGTALKPAWEPICLARKPLVGTVAENVLKHGTGALNIDGCRVGDEERFNPSASRNEIYGQFKGSESGGRATTGRWPANICHDGSDEVLAAFPQGRSAGHYPSESTGTGNGVTYMPAKRQGQLYADSGSAARFFYCAKASRKDREEGLEHLPVKRTGGMSATADGSMLTGSGNERTTARANTHPTVKPTDLMRWLCRLVTPPGGVILDPFMGSGSTGKAALLEGFRFIGCEREDEYMPIAEARIAAALRREPQQAAPAAQAANDNVQRSLFDAA